MSSKARKIFAIFGLEIAILLFLVLLVLIFKTCTDKPPDFGLNPGHYGTGLILAYDPSSTEVSGLYRGGDSCLFYLVGKLTANKINIVTWHPKERKAERAFGILQMEADNQCRIYLESKPGFCPSAKPFTEGEGILFSLEDQKAWQRLRSVKYNNSHVYERQDTSSNKAITLSKFDLVKVIEKDLFWVNVVYGNNDEVTGWILKEDLYRFPG